MGDNLLAALDDPRLALLDGPRRVAQREASPVTAPLNASLDEVGGPPFLGETFNLHRRELQRLRDPHRHDTEFATLKHAG